jgi:hypothetical protein
MGNKVSWPTSVFASGEPLISPPPFKRQKPSKVRKPIRIAVVGMSGVGKSTFLCELCGVRGLFKSSSGGEGCTTEVQTCDPFLIETDRYEFEVTLVDTMGFPDTEKERCIDFYDRVVEACNTSLNAIIWMIQPGRDFEPVVEVCRNLMHEFTKAKPTMIMIANGRADYSDFLFGPQSPENKEAFSKKYAEDFQNFRNYALSFSQAAEVHVPWILASCHQADFKGRIKNELMDILEKTEPKTSSMQTYAQISAAWNACKTEAERAEYCKKRE